eukprot:13333547-Heterocapsa_arctica.AAC.1
MDNVPPEAPLQPPEGPLPMAVIAENEAPFQLPEGPLPIAFIAEDVHEDLGVEDGTKTKKVYLVTFSHSEDP